MRFKALMILLLISFSFNSHAMNFIQTQEELEKYNEESDIVVIASPGRSASTMLTKHLYHYFSEKQVLKIHLLPPDRKFQGKIIFIFSNPDKAAESVLYQTLHQQDFGKEHFDNVETADHHWLKKIGNVYKQTKENNLLSYDAFGTYEHLKAWLHTRTTSTGYKQAQILAIKYENLWDEKTVRAIRKFLDLPRFKLPSQESRGHKHLYRKEKKIRETYNLGTEEDPKYAAYADAKILWEQAPPFQFLKITSNAP